MFSFMDVGKRLCKRPYAVIQNINMKFESGALLSAFSAGDAMFGLVVELGRLEIFL